MVRMLPIRRGGDELIDNFSLVPLVEASRIILFGPNMNNNAFNRIKWDNLFFGQVISFLILLSLSSSFVCRLYSTPCAVDTSSQICSERSMYLAPSSHYFIILQ